MIVAGFEPVAHGLPPDCFLDRDEDAPDLFAVWTRGEDGDIVGSGPSAYEAIREARRTVRGWMFGRLLGLLAGFERGDFCEAGLSLRLGAYVERSPFAPPSEYRKATVAGMPAVQP